MNICLVSRELYPFQKAGIGVYIYNMAKALGERNHNVFILTSEQNQKEYIQTKQLKNVVVVSVNLGHANRLIKDYNYAYSYGVYLSLKKIVSEHSIDLVEFPDYFGEAFFPLMYKSSRGAFSKIPFIIKLHTPTYECNVANNISNPSSILTLQEDYTIKNIDFVYAISNFMKDKISARLHRRDIEVVHNMIDLPSVQKTSDINLPRGKFILFVGRYEERKGIDIFVRAAVNYLEENEENVTFVLIGQDVVNHNSNKMMSEELTALIPDKYRGYFIWKPPMIQEELLLYYQNAYVSIFPSRFEGFGNVCVEAMLLGSPVIVSDNTAFMEIIKDGEYGISFENGNYKDLRDKIINLVNDPPSRDVLSIKSIERGKEFVSENIISIQISYYNKVISSFKDKGINRSDDIRIDLLLKSMDQLEQYFEELIRYKIGWDELKEINQNQITEIDGIFRENQRIVNEWERCRDTIQELRNFIGIQDREIKNLSTSIAEVNKENQRILTEWNSLKELNEAYSKNIRMLEEELEIKQVELSKLQDSYQQKHEEVQALENKITSKKFLIKTLFNRLRGKQQ